MPQRTISVPEMQKIMLSKMRQDCSLNIQRIEFIQEFLAYGDRSKS